MKLIPLTLAIFAAASAAIAQKISPERARLAKEMYSARMEYAKTKDYNPYDTRPRDAVRKVSDLFAKHDFKGVIKEADLGLRFDKFDIDLLMAKAIAYRELKEPKQADTLREKWMAVADSILFNGDGRSFKTAWTVINVSEEYAVMSLLGCRVQRQSLEAHGNSQYDVLKVTRTESGRSLTFYFNIDAPMRRLHQEFSGNAAK